MSTTDGCPCYGAVPLRAAQDQRIWGAPMALLVLIAAHYRFGKNGHGCYASHRRLAELLGGCRQATITDALGKLEAYGYVNVEIAASDRRRRIYKVLYNEQDWAAFKPRTGRGSDAARARPIDTVERINSEPTIDTPERIKSPEIDTPERTELQRKTSQKPLELKASASADANRIYSPKGENISQSSCASMGNPRAGPTLPTERRPGGTVRFGTALERALERYGEKVLGHV